MIEMIKRYLHPFRFCFLNADYHLFLTSHNQAKNLQIGTRSWTELDV